jgi:hypothetical protein
MFRNVFKVFSASLIAMLMLAAAPGATPAAAQALPGDTHMKALLRSAKAPADHQLAAAYFQAQSQQYEAQAAVHEAMLASYRADATRVSSKNQAETIGHCEYLVQEFQRKAVESRKLAAAQQEMASAEQPAPPQGMMSMQSKPTDAAKPGAPAKPDEMAGMKMKCCPDKDAAKVAAKTTEMAGMQMSDEPKPAAKSKEMPGMDMSGNSGSKSSGMQMGDDKKMDCSCCGKK